MALPGLYDIGPNSPIIDARKRRDGGPISTLGQFTQAGGTVAKPPAPDLYTSLQSLMAEFDARDKELSKSAAGLLDTAKGAFDESQKLAGSLQPEDLYAVDKLKNKAQTAQTESEKAALEIRGPLKQSFTPLKFDEAYPQMGTEPIPQRPQAQVNPVAAGLAAIGGFILPHGAAHFGASAIQGAVQRATQTYQDALRTRQMKLDELEQIHKDELGARNEALRLAEDNMERKDRVDLANLLAEGKYSEAHSKLEGELAGQKVLGSDLEGLSVTAKARNSILDKIEVLKNTQKNALDMVKPLQAHQEKIETLKAALQENVLRVKELQQRDAEMAAARGVQAQVGAASHGNEILPPLAPGGPVTVRPIPEGRLGAKAAADLAHTRAETDAAKAQASESAARRQHVLQQIEQIKKGKAPDLSKATPAQRVAMAQMSGAQKVYDSAVKEREVYMRSPRKGKGPLSKDTVYLGMARAEEDAARQLQEAHKAAVESVGGKYGGKIGSKTSAPNTTMNAQLQALAKVRTGQHLSPDEAKTLPKGTKFFGTNGQEYTVGR